MNAPFDRPTTEPGGCECFDCGVIFIGAEWHTRCAVCDAIAAAARQGGDAKQAPAESPQSVIAQTPSGDSTNGR